MAVRRVFTEEEDNILLENYVKCGGHAKALVKLLKNRKPTAISQHMKQAGFKQKMQQKGKHLFYVLTYQDIRPADEVHKEALLSCLTDSKEHKIKDESDNELYEDESDEEEEEDEDEYVKRGLCINNLVIYVMHFRLK